MKRKIISLFTVLCFMSLLSAAKPECNNRKSTLPGHPIHSTFQASGAPVEPVNNTWISPLQAVII